MMMVMMIMMVMIIIIIIIDLNLRSEEKGRETLSSQD